MSTPTALASPADIGPAEDETEAAGDVGLALVLDERRYEHPEPAMPAMVDHDTDTKTDTNTDTNTDTDADPMPGWRTGWTALVVTMLARTALFVIGSLVVLSAAPSLLGWEPSVVMSGSMQPRVAPGDVVIARPIRTDQLSVGQVLLVDDPDRPGQLRLHRLARITPTGLVLRGDANQTNDSTPVKPSAVHGLAVLRVPAIGQPVVWAKTGQFVPVGAAFVLLLILLRVATWWRPMPEREPDTDHDVPSERVSATPPRHRPGAHRRARADTPASALSPLSTRDHAW